MPELITPLGKRITYRGMTGREEDILTDRKKVQGGTAIDEIMANCVEAITTDENGEEKTITTVQQGDIQRLLTPERVALILAIRCESYGDTLESEKVCDSCEEKFHFTVDLSQIEERPLPEDYVPGVGFETKVDGKRVVFDYMDGIKERHLSKMKGNVVTNGMFARLREVEGIHRNDLKKWLLDLPVKERVALRKAMADKDCGPVTDTTVDCAYCGAENHFNVQGVPAFFFPEM